MPSPTRARLGSRASTAVRLLAAALAATSLLVLAPHPVPAGASPQTAAAPSLEQMEVELANRINGERWSRGIEPLPFHTILRDQGRNWSATMAWFDALNHDPDLAAEASAAWAGWTGIAENVGRGTSIEAIHQAFMASPAHRANALGSWRTVGVGIHYARSQLWVTVRFMR